MCRHMTSRLFVVALSHKVGDYQAKGGKLMACEGISGSYLADAGCLERVRRASYEDRSRPEDLARSTREEGLSLTIGPLLG
jgi:hypothetical protein